MSEQITRIYSGKDAEMILAADVIIDAAIENEAAIKEERALWDNNYYMEIKDRIAATAKKYLGANSIQALREATATLANLQATAGKDLTFVKLQIEEDFRKTPERRDTLLQILGLTNANLKEVRNGDQEALGTLLFGFANGLTEEIANELTLKGMNPGLLHRLEKAAVPFQKANAGQETAKSARPQLTQAAIIDFNDLYADVIGIAKIAAKIFTADKALKARFSYSKTIKAMNSYRSNELPATPSGK